MGSTNTNHNGTPSGFRTWCNVTIPDVEGEKLEGSFPMVLLKSAYQLPDLEHAVSQDSKFIVDWIKESGLTPRGNTDEEKAQFAKDVAIFSSYMVPTLPCNSERMKVYKWITTLAILGDDMLEGKDVFGRNSSNGLETAGIAGNIFLGKYPTIDSIPINEKAFGVKSLARAGFVAMQKAKERIPNFLDISAYLAETISMAYSGTLAMELEDHYADSIDDLPVATYQYFRYFEGGFRAFIELAFVCHGKVPTPCMRRNLLFRRIVELGGAICCNVNDLLSVKKELESGIGYNVVVYKARFGNLHEAFADVIKQLTAEVTEFNVLVKRYRSISVGDADIYGVLEVLEQLIDGHTYQFGDSANKRYGSLQLDFVDH